MRYLEYLEFKLVRESLQEREGLLKNMPHIAWPMRFIIPLHASMGFHHHTPVATWLARGLPWLKGRRPDWLIRTGLWLYDHLAIGDILPATRTLTLRDGVEGAPLHPKFSKAFEYSYVWVQDARH